MIKYNPVAILYNYFLFSDDINGIKEYQPYIY